MDDPLEALREWAEQEPDITPFGGKVSADAAETIIEAADYLKTELDAGRGVHESSWLDPLMAAHGELLSASSPSETEKGDG